MVSTAEIARAVYGAWRLALLDRKGLDCFDSTIEAYWKSFNAAVIVAPAYALLLALRLAEVDTRAGFLPLAIVETLAYIIGWVAFPLIMIYVCDRIGRFDRYLRYIVAHNWSQRDPGGAVSAGHDPREGASSAAGSRSSWVCRRPSQSCSTSGSSRAPRSRLPAAARPPSWGST